MISTRHVLVAVALTASVACTTASESATPTPETGTPRADVPAPTDARTTTTTTTTAPSTTAAAAATTTSTTTTTTTSSTATSTEPPTPAATTTVADPTAPCTDALTTREQVALLVWPAIYTADWDTAIATVRDTGIGGVLLMEPTGVTADGLRAMLSELEAASRHGLIVSTDEEGGAVQRLRGISRLASQRDVSQTMTPADARLVIAEHGALVRDVGVDMVLGPVIDVEPNIGSVPLQASRFFAGGPDEVTSYGEAYLDGWNDADLFSTLKHYPGHGAASGDTHITAGVTPSLDDLAEFDLKPYSDLVGAVERTNAAVMVGHLTVPGLTDGVPATRSAPAIAHLRDTLGFGDALIISDALGMAAVGIAEPEASVLALQAGLDIVLFTQTSQTTAVIDAIEQAVTDGVIDDDHIAAAAAKVMAMLGRDGHTCREVGAL